MRKVIFLLVCFSMTEPVRAQRGPQRHISAGLLSTAARASGEIGRFIFSGVYNNDSNEGRPLNPGGSPAAPDSQGATNGVGAAQERCPQVSPPECSMTTGASSPQLDDLQKIAQKPLGKSVEQACLPCMTKEFIDKYNGDSEIAAQAVRDYEKRILPKLRHHLNKKVLNDISKNFESVRYLSANIEGIFASTARRARASQADEKFSELHCVNPEVFKNAVDQKCPNFSSRHAQARKVFEAFGDKFGQDYPTLKIAASIVSAGTSPADQDARLREDRVTYAMTKDAGSGFNLADQFLTQVLKSRELVRFVKRYSEASGGFPRDALRSILLDTTPDNQHLRDKLIKIFPKELLGEDSSKIDEKLNYALNVVTDLHPGLHALLSDSLLFEKSSDLLKKNSSDGMTISQVLEKPPTMMNYLTDKCSGLVQSFAALVCSKDEALVEASNKDDLERFFSKINTGDVQDSELGKVLACERGADVKSAKWKRFPIEDQSIPPSDFFECRKEKSSQKTFRNTICERRFPKDQEVTKYVSQISENYGVTSNYFKSDRFVTNFLKDEIAESFSEQKAVSSSASPSVNSTQKRENNSQDFQETRPETSPSSVLNPVSFSPVIAANPIPHEGMQRPKTEEGKNLNNSRGPASQDDSISERSANQNISATTGPDPLFLQELAKLREEINNGQKQLAEVLEENQRLKEASQKQLSSLEEKRSKMIEDLLNKDSQGAAGNPTSFSGREVGPLSEVSNISRSSSVAASPPGSSSPLAFGRAPSLDGSTGSANAFNGSRSGESVPVLIAVSDKRPTGLELSSSEVTQDIIQYVEKATDVQELMRMRSAGMRYRFKKEDGSYEEIFVQYAKLSEDLKRLIDQKIASSAAAGDELRKINDEIRMIRRNFQLAHLKIQLAETMRLGGKRRPTPK